MKVKKEVFESLRLELQEFTPQEYCDTCWDLVCEGYGNYQYLRTSDQFNKGSYLGTIDNGSRHVIISVQQETPPSNPAVSIQSGGYLWQRVKNNGQGDGNVSGPVSYYVLQGVYHIAGGWNSTNHS